MCPDVSLENPLSATLNVWDNDDEDVMVIVMIFVPSFICLFYVSEKILLEKYSQELEA